MPLLQFATQSRPTRAGAERLINYSFNLDNGALMGRPGLVRYATLAGPVRAMVAFAGSIYAAAGGSLWRVTGGVATNLGAISDDPYTAMTASDSYVVLTAGGRYYACNGVTISTPATGQVATARSVAVMGGYVVVAGSDATRSDRIAVSNADDPLTFDGLDFATAEIMADAIVAILRDHTEIQIIGTQTTETWYNSGGTFPLSPNNGAFSERGCLNGATVAKTDSGVYWFGDDRKVYRRFGGAPQIISTSELNEYLSTATVTHGFAFEARGQKFYALGVSGAPSWALNIATGLWSEFTTGADHGPWIATAALMVDGTQYIGTSDGAICTLGGYDDDGETIRAECYSQPLTEPWNRMNRIEATVDTGFGALGRDRVINLELSRDGLVWSGPKQRSLGDTGEFRRVARWSGQGTYRGFVQARLWITDPVQRDIYGGRVG